CELLSLEEQRRSRAEQRQRGEGAIPGGRRDPVQTRTERGVGDLVVILDIRDERVWREIEAGRASRFLLPAVPLPLIQVPVFRAGNELLRGARVVAVVRLAPARQRDDRGVVIVVVPERIEATSAF